jgi:hypothetical protein
VTSYDLNAPKTQCARSGRALKAGEPIYSVLYLRDGQFVREEIAGDAWQGPPPEAISFWRLQTPAGEDKKPMLNYEALWDGFCALQGPEDARQRAVRFVLALLLLRRKRLKLEGIRKEGDDERLLLRDPRSKQVHEVMNPRLSEAELAELETELARLAA